MELYYGGKIYTMEHENELVEAILVDAGIIVEVGTFQKLQPHAKKLHNLNGATMYPGFVDSHIHIIGLGEKLQRLQLGHVKSKDEMLHEISRAIDQVNEGEWLICEGWNEYSLPNDKMITLEELDAISTRPVLLHRVCHHVLLCNSIAMRESGVTEHTVSPQGGRIGKGLTYRLTGYFYDEATNLILKTLPQSGEAYVRHLTNALDTAIDEMHRFGLVGGHTEDLAYYGHFTNVVQAFQNTIGEKRHFRAHLLRHHKVFEEMMDVDLLEIDDFLEYGAMKIFADGSFGGSTAALLEPYADNAQNVGMLLHSDEQFSRFVQTARKYGEAIAVHMIGDAAAQQVLKYIEQFPAPKGKKDRLIHCCLLNDDLVARMKKLPVILDIQPAFVTSDFPWVQKKIGEHRMKWAYAWKSLSDFECAIGTDAPIEGINPFETIYAAVTRKKDLEQVVYMPHETLSRYDAIKMYSYGSALTINKAHERGLIKVGYHADFTIVDRDLMVVSEQEIKSTRVLNTIVAGELVYCNTCTT